jgi:hypothetical protein
MSDFSGRFVKSLLHRIRDLTAVPITAPLPPPFIAKLFPDIVRGIQNRAF